MVEQTSRENESRLRGGLIAMLIGVFLLLWVWLMVMLGSPNPPALTPRLVQGDGVETMVADEEANRREIQRLRSMPLMLFAGLVLVLVFLIGSFVLARSTRRFALGLTRGRAKPTSTSDVWSMHVLPEDQSGRPDSTP